MSEGKGNIYFFVAFSPFKITFEQILRAIHQTFLEIELTCS